VFLDEKKKRKEQGKAEREDEKKRRYLGQERKQQGNWKIYLLEKLEEMKVCKKNLRIKEKKWKEEKNSLERKMENEETRRRKNNIVIIGSKGEGKSKQ
jgi:polynucleotide 5'-kinase involved in rRNA processing